MNHFPRSLRPSFPTGLLDFDLDFLSQHVDEEISSFPLALGVMDRLKERVGLFFEEFFVICGDELGLLSEYHDFIDSTIEVLKSYLLYLNDVHLLFRMSSFQRNWM